MAKLRTLFLTAGDMERWFEATEVKLGWKLKFVDSNLCDAPQGEHMHCRDLPGFGLSTSGERNHNTHYILLPATSMVVWESFRANDGQTRYQCSVDENPGLVGFEPSGVCAPTHIVTGEFGTRLKDPMATAIHKALSQVLRKQCHISGNAAVGEEALALHWAGYRLNDRLTAAHDSDLVIPKPEE